MRARTPPCAAAVQALSDRRVTGMEYLQTGNGMFYMLPLSSRKARLRQQFGLCGGLRRINYTA